MQTQDIRNDISLDYLPEEITLTGYFDTLLVFINHEILDIQTSRSIYNHSTEFNWGYNGSGPAQLALAILLEFLPYKLALEHYHRFKDLCIVGLPEGQNFEIKINLKDILSGDKTSVSYNVNFDQH